MGSHYLYTYIHLGWCKVKKLFKWYNTLLLWRMQSISVRKSLNLMLYCIFLDQFGQYTFLDNDKSFIRYALLSVLKYYQCFTVLWNAWICTATVLDTMCPEFACNRWVSFQRSSSKLFVNNQYFFFHLTFNLSPFKILFCLFWIHHYTQVLSHVCARYDLLIDISWTKYFSYWWNLNEVKFVNMIYLI